MGLVGKYIQPAFNAFWNIGQKASAVGPLVSLQFMGRAIWTERDYGQFSEEGYKKNVVVYVAISRVSQAVALPKWTLSKKGGEKIDEHPLLDLLNNPNPLMNGRAFMENLVAFRLISGNSYAEAVGPNNRTKPPTELHVLRPDRMKIKAGPTGYPSEYVYEVGQHKKSFKVNFVTMEIPILHWKTFHPLDDFYGLSPLEAAARSVDIHNSGQEWNKSLLDNSAQPSGALQMNSDGALTEGQFKRLQEQVKERMSGPRNAGKPLVLEGGLQWMAMSLTPKEVEFLEGKNTSAREIAMVYGFPPQLLGIPGDNTYSNLQEARLGFWEDTVIPLREDLTADLEEWLVPRFGGGLKLDFDKDSIPALALRRERTYERVQKADFLTINEKREQVGLEEVPGGDVILQPATLVPLTETPPEPNEDNPDDPEPDNG